MKKITLISIIISFVITQTNAQNRIAGWDTEKITTIKVEIQKNGEIEKSIFFSEKDQMDKIFKFLKSVEFTETKEAEVKNQSTSQDWTSRFIFRGQRDWVLFFDNSATIGKTSFWIEQGVNEKVKKLIEELEKE